MEKPNGPPKAATEAQRIDALAAHGKADPAAMRTLRCRTVAQGRFSQLNYIRDLAPQPVMEVEPILDALVKHATLWSPVANTLHNPVHLDVALAPA